MSDDSGQNASLQMIVNAIFELARQTSSAISLAPHASQHASGLGDEFDGDNADIDWDPSNYTPDATPAEASGVDSLTAHLKGIDTVLGSVVSGPGANTDGFIPQWDGDNSLLLKSGLSFATTVGDPGSDTTLVSEQGIREALDAGAHGTTADWKDHADVNAAISDSDAQGDIIHRDATEWNRLAKGTDGQCLKSGASDVSWEDDIAPLEIIIDGGGSAITTGEKGHIEVPYDCTIQRVTLLADQSGSIVVDIWKGTYADFPPTDVDSITASAPPTISSAQKSQDSTLSGWTTSVAAGDILAFNVDSASTITRVTLSLKVKKT